MTVKTKCGTCGKAPVEGCSRIDCAERKTITAAPSEDRGAYRLAVITSEDYFRWCEKGVRDANEI
jgi:hypothetical protein